MTDNEFLLNDRLTKIESIITRNGEDNFYISYSGGKDSNVLSLLVDMAIPGNKIPRVYANTGIELNAVLDFVEKRVHQDGRINIIRPKVPIKKTLKQYGYPFKSKEHSEYVAIYQSMGDASKTVTRYLHPAENREKFGCPKILRYQFSEKNKLKISDRCCAELKERPLAKWQKDNKKPYAIVGIRRDEGGRRNRAQCLLVKSGKLSQFHPLAVVTEEWEEWFIEKYKVELPAVYSEPFNFTRTGCKGCPFNTDLQAELNQLRMYSPAEYVQCESIWKPVYEEYRKLNYRLTDDVNQLSIWDF